MEDEKIAAPLQDVVDMVTARPELTQEEWEIANKALPWLRAQVKIELRKEFEVEYAKKLAAELDAVKELNKQYVDEQFAAIRKAQEPLGEDEIKKLLSQEYLEFKFKAYPKSGSSDTEPREFVIRELPSEVEERFFKLLKKILVPVLQERENIVFRLEQGSTIEKIQTVLNASEKALELGSDIVAVCLDPWQKDPDINGKWVRTNLSTQRQAAVILAQYEANKYRDFFSQGFRSFLKLRT